MELYQSGELLKRVGHAYARLKSCDLCPHECRVNRMNGETGFCGAGLFPRIASASVHRGEEPPISGTRGSGTIFLSGCTLRCKFCQNFPISQLGNGTDVRIPQLAAKMLGLQRKGVHNVNFVTPGHFFPQILAALYLAIKEGFRLPIVWNSSGYERVDSLLLLDGVVDIYLPDMKYSDDQWAMNLSSVTNYPEVNRAAVMEMFRQVGHLTLDEDGIALKGLIIRHLVLPESKGGSCATLRWIADSIGTETHISLMNQYFPAHKAAEIPGLERKITDEEYEEAVDALEEAGLENGWVQE